MKNNKIILDDEYFIEVDSLNWTLKRKRKSLKSKDKVIGHYSCFKNVLLKYKDESLNKACFKRDRIILIEQLIELINQVENRLKHAISTLKLQ